MDRCLDVEIVGTCCMYSKAIWNNMIILYNHSKLDLNEKLCLDISRLLVGCELLDWNMSDPSYQHKDYIVYIYIGLYRPMRPHMWDSSREILYGRNVRFLGTVLWSCTETGRSSVDARAYLSSTCTRTPCFYRCLWCELTCWISYSFAICVKGSGGDVACPLSPVDQWLS